MSPSHRLPIHTVVYWNDLEPFASSPGAAAPSSEGWEQTKRLLLDSQMEGVDFYYIREHELRHQPLDVIQPRLRLMGACAAELRALGMHTSLAFVPTLGWGQEVEENPFEKITGPDGVRSGVGACPLGPDLRAYLLGIARAAVAAGFDSITLEDDFQNDNHRPVKQGCFCDRHLSAFAQHTGTPRTRDALADALKTDPSLQQQWRDFRLDVLADLVRQLHDAANAVKPGVTLTLNSGVDVNFAPVKLFKAVQMRCWRPSQGGYADTPLTPLETAWRGSLMQDLHGRPHGLTARAEITSWPRNSYTKSWATILLQAAANSFLGMDALLLWIGQGQRDPGFVRTIGGHRRWLDAIRQAYLQHPQPRGIVVPIHPTGYALSKAHLTLARMGLPIVATPWPDSTHREDPLLLPARDAYLPDGIARLQGRPIILDADSINALGNELGLRLVPTRTFASCEHFGQHEACGGYRGMYSSCLTLLPAGEVRAVQGTPDAQTLAEYRDNDDQPITPSVLLDHAARRLIFNHSAKTWDLLMGFGKAEHTRLAVEALLGRPLCAATTGAADLALLVRDSQASRVALTLNLSYDPAVDWSLPMDFIPQTTHQLRQDGSWQELSPQACPARGAAAAIPPRLAILWRFTKPTS